MFVVLPLMPAFEGEMGTTGGTAIQTIMHWNAASISQGPHSLLVRLREAGIKDPTEYICFHGLRTHSELRGFLVCSF